MCMGLCVREKEDDSGSLCVLSWLTGPVTMMSSTWLVSTPIAVEVLTLLGFILGVTFIFIRSTNSILGVMTLLLCFVS